jgi:NitT/TauT family transport system ATP-binding protein
VLSQFEPLIKIDRIEKRFRSRQAGEIVALTDITFDVRRGEFVSIVGPSGCGKSTLLLILAALVSASSGTVWIDGARVSEPRRDVGVVFQKPVLLPWKTVLENVLLPIQVFGENVNQFRDRAKQLLKMVGLDESVINKYPFELSGGMQQRNSIVRALIADPEILLMDEPFGALDALTREQLNLDLQEIWLESGKTVVFVTHSIPEALFLGDRVVVFAGAPGRIVDIVEVPVRRPRTLDVMGEDWFAKQAKHIREQLATPSR